MLTVYSEDHRGHAPKYELTFGQFLPCFEKPSRAEMVLARVKDVGLGRWRICHLRAGPVRGGYFIPDRR